MSDNMARYKRHKTTNSSSCRDQRKEMEESMLKYHTSARQMNAHAIYIDHIPRVTSLGSEIQHQFRDTYTEKDTFKRQHRHPHIASLNALHSTMGQEYYQTKRHEEYVNPRHDNKSHGLFTVIPDDAYVGRQSKNHIHAEMNSEYMNALEQYRLAAQNSQKNILKKESARLLMKPVYGNSHQHGDYRAQRSLFILDPLDFDNSAHDARMYDLMAESQQSPVSLVKRHNINDSSCVSTDKNIQIDLGFRSKQKLIPVRENKNNAELQSTDSERSVSTVNKVKNTNVLHITSAPDFLRAQAESQYPDPASIPIRLLQRPQRAKRLDLHTPHLGVIPEAGNICAHSENLELDRKIMLSSKPLLIRNTNFVSMNRSGLEKSRNAKDLKL